jgi:hypothetical protein
LKKASFEEKKMLPSEQNEPLFGSEFETDFTLFNKIRLKHFSALLGRRKTFFAAFREGFCRVYLRRGLPTAEISDLLLI